MVVSRFFCMKMQNKCWPSGPSSCCGHSLEYKFSKTTQNLLGSLWNMSSAFHMFPFQIHGDVRKHKVASPRKGPRSPGEIPFPTWLKYALFHKKSRVLNWCVAVDCCFNAHYTLLLQRERVVRHCIASWCDLIFIPCLIFLWGELCVLPVKLSLWSSPCSTLLSHVVFSLLKWSHWWLQTLQTHSFGLFGPSCSSPAGTDWRQFWVGMDANPLELEKRKE